MQLDNRVDSFYIYIIINPKINVTPNLRNSLYIGHTDFAFAEDGIIIVHSQRNFPVAADIILFW